MAIWVNNHYHGRVTNFSDFLKTEGFLGLEILSAKPRTGPQQTGIIGHPKQA